MVDYFEVAGYIAGTLFATSLFPQLYKSCKTKKLNDLSFGWLFIYIIGSICSLIYSIHNNLAPIYLSAFIELTTMLILIYMKFHYRQKIYPIDNIENIENI
tara:strand:- start:1028 stop:1330 length:303 start_codon:yes stop_codon:yes gene_type:complete